MVELTKVSWDLYFATNNCAQSYREFGAEYVSYKNRYHPFVWFIINVVVRIKYKMLVL
jgi:hypothetical protein